MWWMPPSPQSQQPSNEDRTPPEIKAAFMALSHLEGVEEGRTSFDGGPKGGGRTLTKHESALNETACEMIRLFITGEQKFTPPKVRTVKVRSKTRPVIIEDQAGNKQLFHALVDPEDIAAAMENIPAMTDQRAAVDTGEEDVSEGGDRRDGIE